MQVIQYIVDLGPSVMIPIIIFILGIFCDKALEDPFAQVFQSVSDLLVLT